MKRGFTCTITELFIRSSGDAFVAVFAGHWVEVLALSAKGKSINTS